MAQVIFERSFSRQVGGAPPPPAIGSDVLPANVAGVELLDNGWVFASRTLDYSVSSIAVSHTSPVPTIVEVEVYIGDEERNTWFNVGQLSVFSNQISRFAIFAGPGTTRIPVYVRPIPQALPPGEYRFFFGTDQAARPLPNNTSVIVTGTVTVAGSTTVAGVMPIGALGSEPVRSSSQVVKVGGGTLWLIYANNDTNADIWLMTFDVAAVPPNGTPPLDFVQIPRRNNGEAGIYNPRTYRNGIVWAASTTRDTLTLAGAVLLARPRYE